MKLNKKIFISVLLVLMMLCIIGTASAADSLDNNLTAETTMDDAVSVAAGDDSLAPTDEKLLSEGETTIYVDSNYDGDELGTEDNPYKSISTAVSNSNGGETIFIKNGEYTENAIKDLAKPLTFTGQTQDGVIIRASGSEGFVYTTKDYSSLTFNNLTFKDMACTGSYAVMFIGSSGNVSITNCVFDNTSGRYGALRIFSSGNVVVDNCKFLNTKSTSGSYSSAIDFGGSSDYTIKNTIIDGSSKNSTATYFFGVIYNEKTSNVVTLDNVTIINCNATTATGLIATKGSINIKNSKIMDNYVYRDFTSGGLIWISGGNTYPAVNVETTVIFNNTEPNYIVSANGPKCSFNLSYNNIQNNTFNLNFTNPSYEIYTLDYNYWGSNDGPADVNLNVSNWAIDNCGEFTLNDGTPLAKEIPILGDAPIGDENSTWVSTTGDDNNTGSADSPVATIAKAVDIAKNKSGEIFIEEGTYTESNIVLDSEIPISITGIGNIVIDGNASSDSIFILHNNATLTFTNIRFTNNNAKYGGAIFVNSGTGTGRTTLDVDITVDNCIFDNMESSSRGAGIYLWYTKGYLNVIDSQFVNLTAGSWGGAICVGQSALNDGLNVEISGSTFENCSANNGGACYLQANTLTVTDSVFNHNAASYDSAAMQIYNSTAIIDNCIITNNQGGSQGVAIKETMPSKAAPRLLTITNSVIENNTGRDGTQPAIYVDMTTLDVSYSSLVNDLSVETRTATGYDAIYGQGIATLNNNWWGTNDPSSKVTGTNITMDNWVIMNVEANVTEAVIGDKVGLTVDFNHVNTTAGEIEELTGGVIPKTYKVQLSSNNGTIVPAALTVKDGATKNAVYTVADINDVVSVSSEEALVELSFAPAIPPYYGVIYVSKDGDDSNNGSEEYPVASIAKAIELASIVGGSGQIIVNEGTYNGTEYVISKNLTITGVGDVILDAEGKGRLFYLPSVYSFDKFELNGLTLANSAANSDAPSGYYGTVIYNYAASEIVLINVNIIDNNGGASTLISTNGYALVINNSTVRDNAAGKLIAASGKYDSLEKSVLIINTTFENNAAPDYRIIEVGTSSGSMTLNLTDSHFIGNTGKLGIVQADAKTTVNVVGSEFVSNTNNISSGGAIDAYTLIVENSLFEDNKAARSAGAIYINRNGNAVITKSSFVNNTAGEKGSAIYNNNELTINYCVLLTNSAGNIIYHDGGDNVMDANYNWWGSNDDPSALIGVGTYEDDWGDDVPCEFDASKWVVMTVNNNLTVEPLEIGDEVEFTVDFNHYTDSTGTSYELTDSIPEVEVSASAIKGELDNDKVSTVNNVAIFIYTAAIGGEDEVTIASSNAVNTTTVNINEPVVIEVVYVSPDGDDSNIGSYDSPVATIAHAIEIAERGKIVIFEGTYTINSTLVIDKDLDIRGEGTVIIDGNLTRVIENTANLNLTNIQFTNAKKNNGAVVYDSGNLTVNACTFYGNTATATSGGSILHNLKGNMIVNNSKFYGNAATRGAVNSQIGTNLTVNNSEFYDNDMTTAGNAYGMIYATGADVIVENTVFRNNKVQNGGAIYATRSNTASTGSLNVFNCTFENNTAEKGTGGAIFMSAAIQSNIANSTFINNTATVGSYSGGQGGAIYVTGTSKATVTNSIFIDNYAKDKYNREDAGLFAYASATSTSSIDISNSFILAREGFTGYALNRDGNPSITAENNFWGSNSNPNVNATVEKWVIMSADYDEATGALSVSFDKTNSTDGTIADYDDVLPDGFNVTVSSSSGTLDETLPVVAGQASTTYIPSASEDIIVKSGSAEIIIPVIIEPKVIYVAKDGDDSNTGSIDDPVATLAHAIEIAEGKIVIMEGTYATGDLGIISTDLNITGNGTVIIDAQNANRILYVGEDANVVLENLIMINGFNPDESGALLGNAKVLTLINCTLANSSAGEHNGGAIYNVGKLTIINSTIANNTAKLGGAIFTNDAMAVGSEITIINSTFENNIANGNDNSGGGAIFAQQLAGMTIANATFIGNEALTTSSGGAIFISHSDAEFTITDSRFIANHANGKEGTGGGAIYMVGTSNYERKGKLTISNTLFEENTADENGAAIYARATTVDVSNSVIFANKDPAGFSVYGYKTDQVTPAMNLNDNWWGTNIDPNDYVGGNDGYKPTISRWVILTATNDTPIAEGNTVKITVSLDTYTDGNETGTLTTPITIPRDVSIVTTFDSIEGVLENGEFTTDYLIPADLKYLSAVVDTEEVVLYKVKTETVVDAESIKGETGDTIGINVTVKTIDGYIMGEVPVTLLVDDIINSTYTTDENGYAYIPIDGLTPGDYTALIVFEGDDDYAASNASVDVVINKIDTILTASEVNAIYLDGSKLVATLTDDKENPISDVKIKFVIPGAITRYVRTDANGQASLDVSEFNPGKYWATITFVATETYNRASTTARITVKTVSSLVADDLETAYNSGDNITATLTDSYGEEIIGASVIVELDGVNTTYTTDGNGQIFVPVTGIVPGNYTAVFTFAGDNVNNATSASADVVINTMDTIVTASDVNATYGIANNLVATLTDANGNPISDAKLKIVIPGAVTKYIRTDANGQVALNIANYGPGKYTATITFVANDLYNKATTTAKIIVSPKKETTLTVSDLETAYNSGDNLTATLSDENGEAITGAEVLVQFNGENSTLITDENGQVSVSTDGLVPGDYAADFTFVGDDAYNGSNATANVVVDTMDTNLTALDVNATYKDGSKLIATLTDANGNVISDAKIKFAVSGKSAKYVRTDANGQAALSLANYDVGTYRATITFVATDLYNKSTTTARIVINEA